MPIIADYGAIEQDLQAMDKGLEPLTFWLDRANDWVMLGPHEPSLGHALEPLAHQAIGWERLGPRTA
jgi:hypothetical protein